MLECLKSTSATKSQVLAPSKQTLLSYRSLLHCCSNEKVRSGFHIEEYVRAADQLMTASRTPLHAAEACSSSPIFPDKAILKECEAIIEDHEEVTTPTLFLA